MLVLIEIHIRDRVSAHFTRIHFLSDKPSRPESIKVTSTGQGTISVSWDKCSSDGGSAITQYVVEVCLASDTNYMLSGTVSGDQQEFTCAGLIDGSDYFVRVKAENVAGSGKPAELSESVKARLPVGKLHYQLVSYITSR